MDFYLFYISFFYSMDLPLSILVFAISCLSNFTGSLGFSSLSSFFLISLSASYFLYDSYYMVKSTFTLSSFSNLLDSYGYSLLSSIFISFMIFASPFYCSRMDDIPEIYESLKFDTFSIEMSTL